MILDIYVREPAVKQLLGGLVSSDSLYATIFNILFQTKKQTNKDKNSSKFLTHP